VSDEVVELVVSEYPAVARIAVTVVEDQVRDNVYWSYSTPQRETSDLYALTATASVEFEITVPLLDAQEYSASVPFALTVDTGARSVADWFIIVSDARVRVR
jgi:hypothetical protein